MKKQVGRIAIFGLVAATTTACATKGFVREQIAQERAQRVQSDSMLAGDVAAVREDVATLRNELQMLRTEFGAKITAMEEGLQFAFPVNFAFDDATVREQDRAALERFASVVGRYYAGSKITVEGFADPAGSVEYNRQLSARRAEAVRDYLLAQGMVAEQINTVGYGETRQVNPGAQMDDPGAEENRRVVFVVESRGQSGIAMLGLEPEG